MNEKVLELVCTELSATLAGKQMGAVFPLSRFEFAIDFRITSGLFLFISVEPGCPRVYLTRRRLKEMSRASIAFSPFLLLLRKHLTGAEVISVSKISNERALKIEFGSRIETGGFESAYLIIQMTGRSANVFLLDSEEKIIDSFRTSELEGQRPNDMYQLPPRPDRIYRSTDLSEISFDGAGSISELLDARYLKEEKDRKFRSRAESQRKKLAQQISRRRKLIEQLRGDLAGHGDADKWKRLGDLLLANTTTARRDGKTIVVKDIFADDQPDIEIGSEENESVTEAAERCYKRYTKARNAALEVAKRLTVTEAEIDRLEQKRNMLEEAIAAEDEGFFEKSELERPSRPGEKRKAASGFSGARTFTSSDGMEILVGKKAVDNDHLTFRLAKSLDFWLHAADYPGSHVVVRNPNRKDVIPQKTLLESAQLAAFYSNAKTQPKAAVNYTQKKFVSKPKGGAPGLARLSKFKTILVEPRVPETITKKD
jgi:predicted ribosome quality control (RQC) complex YloA/Tae2 family protein